MGIHKLSILRFHNFSTLTKEKKTFFKKIFGAFLGITKQERERNQSSNKSILDRGVTPVDDICNN